MVGFYSKWNLLFVFDDAGLASRNWVIFIIILKNKAIEKLNMDYPIHVLIQFFPQYLNCYLSMNKNVLASIE